MSDRQLQLSANQRSSTSIRSMDTAPQFIELRKIDEIGPKWNWYKMNKRFEAFAEFIWRFYNEKLVVISAWRNKDNLEEKDKSQPGAHTYGEAIDILFPRSVKTLEDKYTFIDRILGQTFKGIGIYNYGLHLDYGVPGNNGRRAWRSDDAGKEPLNKENGEIYKNKIQPWRRGDSPTETNAKIIGDLTEKDIRLQNDDSNFESAIPTHPIARKDAELIEGNIKSPVKDYNFNFSNGRLLFGDLFLHVPPININVLAHNQTFNFETIRTAGNPTISTSEEVININMDLFFANTNSINNELRRILAMYIRTPFITLENDFIFKALKKVYNNELKEKIMPVVLNSITLSTVPGFPNSVQATLTLNDFEPKILTNKFEYLIQDSDVSTQNELFAKAGDRTIRKFKDKYIVSSSKRAYKSLPFMKYYQSLLYKENGPVLDPNGNQLVLKDGERPKVYENDNVFYKKGKFLSEYKENANKSYLLKFYEANLDYAKERLRNREKYVDRLKSLRATQELLKNAGLLEFFEYNPNKRSPGLVSSVLDELKDVFDSFGNSIFNINKKIVADINNPLSRQLYLEVIRPIVSYVSGPEVENLPIGQKSPGLITKDTRFFNTVNKAESFPELLQKFNKKINGPKAKLTDPNLSATFVETIREIFDHLAAFLNNEIEDEIIRFQEPLDIIIGDKNSVVTNITANFSNKLIPIHLQFWNKPAYQHMGSNDWEFTMNIRCTNTEKIEEIKTMIEKYKATARKVMNLRPDLVYKNTSYIDFSNNKGSLLDMLGIRNAVIIDYNFSTVQNQPNATDIVLRFKQADLTIDAHEKINFNGSSPDDLILYLQKIFKRFQYDRETRRVSIFKLKPKPANLANINTRHFTGPTLKRLENPEITDVILYKDPPGSQKAEEAFEEYISIINFHAINNPEISIMDWRKNHEVIIGEISDPTIIDLMKGLDDQLRELYLGKELQLSSGRTLTSEPLKDDIPLYARFSPGLSVYNFLFNKIRETDLYQRIFSTTVSYFINSDLYNKILGFVHDPTFRDFIVQVDSLMNTNEGTTKYNNWINRQTLALTPNYPDMYLPVFPNNFSDTDSQVYTPPDFYYRAYSFINETFIEDLEDFITNSFDIESNLYALNGKINAEQYKVLREYIEKNKAYFAEQLRGVDINKLDGFIREMEDFTRRFYKELYNLESTNKEKIDTKSIVSSLQLQEFFLIVMKNLVYQRYKEKDTGKLLPEGKLKEFFNRTLKKIEEGLLAPTAVQPEDSDKEVSEKIIKDPDKIFGSLMRNVTDLNFLNLVSENIDETEFEELTKGLQSYWGFGVKGLEKEANRLERIYNARTNSNLLKVGRAYPAFKIYFIEEDKNEWLFFDDFYSYSAINSIEVISNKNAASDTAVVRLSNLANRLMNDKSENINSENFLDGRNPENEQKVESLLLKPGTNMMIKLGYSNNPQELETVFQGVITEIQPGQIVEIICQSYGNQLNTLIDQETINWKSLEKQYGDIVTFILNKIPGLDKLGKYSPISGGKADPLRTPGNLWFRGLRGKFNLVSSLSGLKIDNFNLNDPRDDNIYLKYTNDKSFWRRLTFDWRIFNQTAWDAIQEILLYHPDYIAKVLPYNENKLPGNGDIRQTLYVGPKSGAYKYTDSFGIIADRVKDIEWDRILSIFYTAYGKSENIIRNIENFINDANDEILSENRESKLTSIDIKRIDDLVKSAFNLIVILDTNFFGNINFPVFSGDFESLTDKLFWIKQNKRALIRLNTASRADFRKNDSALEYYYNVNWRLNPQYRPVRNDHIVNSAYHIIRNNISASSEQIFNKVVMTFPKSEPTFTREIGDDLLTYEVTVDDNIFDEYVKEYHTFQKNIDTNRFDLLDRNLKLINRKTAAFSITEESEKKYFKQFADWQKYPTYMRVAMNILSKQMERMYVGNLIIWGNPQIKPWDVIHIDDITADMKGSFEVEQVIHRFDAESGFTTSIRPNLITHVQNPEDIHDEAVVDEIMHIAGKKAIYSAIGNALFPLDFPANLFVGLPGQFTRPALSGTASFLQVDKIAKFLGSQSTKVAAIGSSLGKLVNPISIIGSLLYGGWKGYTAYSDFIIESVGKLYGRNAIWFAPLKHKGQPYVAGLEGYKEDTYFQHVIHRMKNSNFIQRMGFTRNPLDAVLIDGDNVGPFTYFKTLFYGRDINDSTIDSKVRNKNQIPSREQ